MALLADGSGDANSNLVQGNGTNSLTFTMPKNVALNVSSVLATINNAAGADTTATMVIRDQSGEVIATKRQLEAIPAGDTGTANWSLRDDDNGGTGTAAGFIRFAFDNVGEYLTIRTTGQVAPAISNGIVLEASKAIVLDSDAEVTIQAGTDIATDSVGQTTVNAGGDLVVTTDGDASVTAASGDVTLDAQTVHAFSTGATLDLKTTQAVLSGLNVKLVSDTGPIDNQVANTQEFFVSDAATPGNHPLRIKADGTQTFLTLQAGGTFAVRDDAPSPVLEVLENRRVGFFGVTPVAQQATPVTLANVIALLQAYGLSA